MMTYHYPAPADFLVMICNRIDIFYLKVDVFSSFQLRLHHGSLPIRDHTDIACYLKSPLNMHKFDVWV